MIISIQGKAGSGKDTVGRIIQLLTLFPEASPETIEEYLIEQKIFYNETFTIKKWAYKLKQCLCILINCKMSDLENENFKNTPLPELWWKIQISMNKYVDYLTAPSATKRILESYPDLLIKTTPRILLQLLGTECGRDILHPNVWVNSLMSEYAVTSVRLTQIDFSTGESKDLTKPKVIEHPNWIITDTRFPNEYNAVKDKGFSIRVENEFLKHKMIHSSETALDNYKTDYTIDNGFWHQDTYTKGSYRDLIEDTKRILITENLI